MESPDVRAILERWERKWGVPDLADGLTITFSPRLEQSLGRCRPASGRITLADRLKSGNPVLLIEVLCHEAAHVAVHRLFGAAAKPHGPEWRDLVHKAGFSPRVRMPRGVGGDRQRPGARQTPAPAAAPRYEHRCPVCQSARFARRPVPSWVCTECTGVGLPGTLVISRVDGPQSGAATDA